MTYGTMRGKAEWVDFNRTCPYCGRRVPRYARACSCGNSIKNFRGRVLPARPLKINATPVNLR